MGQNFVVSRVSVKKDQLHLDCAEFYYQYGATLLDLAKSKSDVIGDKLKKKSKQHAQHLASIQENQKEEGLLELGSFRILFSRVEMRYKYKKFYCKKF